MDTYIGELKMSDEFTKIENHSHALYRCPICGADAELWELDDERRGIFKFVACSRKEDRQLIEGIDCPLVFPEPTGFYRATQREAIRAWNEFAQAAEEARLIRNEIEGG